MRSRRRRVLSGIGLFAVVGILAVAVMLVVPHLEERSGARLPEGHEQASVSSLFAFWGWSEQESDVRAGSDSALTASSEQIQAEVEFIPTDDVEYEVAEGETLSEIALAHDVDVDLLAAVNDIPDPDTIGAGVIIVIPGTLSRGRGLTSSALSELYPSTSR